MAENKQTLVNTNISRPNRYATIDFLRGSAIWMIS